MSICIPGSVSIVSLRGTKPNPWPVAMATTGKNHSCGLVVRQGQSRARWQAADQGSATTQAMMTTAVGGYAQRVRRTRAQGTLVERQQRGSGSLDSGAWHGTSRSLELMVGAAQGSGRKEMEIRGGGGGGINLFIKLHGKLKGPEVAEEPGMNFTIIAKFMHAPISNL